jgi:hypothetical protein
VHLYGKKESPKYERAAMRWLERYRSESLPKKVRDGRREPRWPTRGLKDNETLCSKPNEERERSARQAG